MMIKMVKQMQSIISKEFWTDKIAENKCRVDISREPDPKLIIRYDSRRPTFGNVVDSMVKLPDFLFVSDHPQTNGRLFIIELSSGRQKSRNSLKEQLSSGIDQLKKRLEADGVDRFESNPIIRAIYCGKLHPALRRDMIKHPIEFTAFGKKFGICIIKNGDDLSKVK